MKDNIKRYLLYVLNLFKRDIISSKIRVLEAF